MWQWHNYSCDQIPEGKLPLRINLDETSICLYQGQGRGAVFIDKERGPPSQKVPRGRRRCCMTHVTLVCDRPDVQAVMPHFLIGNKATFLVRDMPALLANCPPNTTIIRQTSAWNNEVLCAAIVRELGRVLEPFRGVYQPILLFDAVRIHLTRRVLAALHRAVIWPVLVPAKMTWLLQPLDTHAFRLFKIALRREYQAQRLRGAVADLSVGDFLACVYTATSEIFDTRCWAHAFAEDGFGNCQAELSAYARKQLRIEGVPLAIPATEPSVEQLRACFPRRAALPLAALRRPYEHGWYGLARRAASAASGSRGPVDAGAAGAGAAFAKAAPVSPLRGRTRSGCVYSQPWE